MKHFIRQLVLFFSCIACSTKPLSIEQIHAHVLKLISEEQFDAAVHILEHLHTKIPNDLTIQYNIAYILKKSGKYRESLNWYQKVIDRTPDKKQVHIGYAQSLLALGNFAAGFAHLAYRVPDQLKFNLPVTNLEKLSGKRLVIKSEWGFGDLFHFIRYARELKKYNVFIILQTYKELKPLLSLCDYLDEVVTYDESLPPYDFVIPLLSVPELYHQTCTHIPTFSPYLFADKQLIQKWRTISTDKSHLHVGICWHGAKKATDSISFDKNIPLDAFQSIAQLPFIKLYDLQRVTGKEQHPSFELISFPNDFDATGNFMDTAALMHHLDFVITCDTATAHLAGALNIPTLVLLPKRADWRWQLAEYTTPWYPSVQLFRQTKPSNWTDVMNYIKNYLYDHAVKVGLTS